MPLLPLRPGRLNDPSFLTEFRDLFSANLMDLITRPGSGYDSELGQTAKIVENFNEGSRLPRGNRDFDDRFVRICQDVRLSCDEIDILKSMWFS